MKHLSRPFVALLLCAMMLFTACAPANPGTNPGDIQTEESKDQTDSKPSDTPTVNPGNTGCPHPEESLTQTILDQDCAHVGLVATICSDCNSIIKKDLRFLYPAI